MIAKKSQVTLHFLLHSADLVEERLRTQLAPLGLRPRQARVLEALYRMVSASQIELAREFDISAASMSTMTSRLIAAGFISCQANPEERRSNLLTVTAKGVALLDQIIGAWEEVDGMIENAIGAKKAKQLSCITEELRDALGGQVPGTAGSRSGKAVTVGD